MPSYDADAFTPPAPVAKVTLRDSDGGTEVVDVPMLLDTGADVTLVPRVVTEELGIAEQIDGDFELLGFDGRPTTAGAVELQMIFGGGLFRGRFLVMDEQCGILGRNILNSLTVLYDGPGLRWALH